MAESSTNNRSRQMTLAYLVLLNLIPLYGVFGMGWDAKLLLLAYFMETIIAVLFHAIRLWYLHWRWGKLPESLENAKTLAAATGATTIEPSFLPLLMLAVYGMFWSVQLMVLGGFAEKTFPEGIFTSLWYYSQHELAWVTIGCTAIQFMRLVREVFTNQYRAVPIEQLFFQPFRRILIQQLVVILGGFFLVFGALRPYLFLLVALNLAVDLFAFYIENTKLRVFATGNDPVKEKQFDEMKRMLKY